MADFVAVLKKTLDGLGETTPATRQRVYDKARATITAKLAALNPPPPDAVADRQKRALDDAIATLEKEYAAAEAAMSDPLAELENVFASLKNPQPKQLSPQPAPVAAPPPPPVSARTITTHPVERPAPRKTTTVPPAAFAEEQESFSETIPIIRETPRRSYGGLIAAALAVVVLGAGGYGVWLNRGDLGEMIGLGGSTEVAEAPAETAPAAAPPAAETPAAVAETPAAAAGEGGKFTQRLTAEGSEVDPGPAGGNTSVGEGTSVAELTQPPTAPAEGAVDIAAADVPAPAPAPAETPAPAEATAETPAAAPATPPAAPAAAEPAAVPVGQRAIFYEERTANAQGSAESGQIVWSLVQESPGGDLPAEPAIRAEATIPGKNVQLRMTIKRNADRTLPASHIIEMIFLTPQGFEGGGIDNILRVAMKGSEQEAGNPLIGIPAKIADGFFLVALNDAKADIDANVTLLRRQAWIDVPVVYKSGRRALFTMEKGIPGDKVFDEALKAWQVADAG